jgi:hypothetical protein
MLVASLLPPLASFKILLCDMRDLGEASKKTISPLKSIFLEGIRVLTVLLASCLTHFNECRVKIRGGHTIVYTLSEQLAAKIQLRSQS